jgi:hypothetical protein
MLTPNLPHSKCRVANDHAVIEVTRIRRLWEQQQPELLLELLPAVS